MANTSRTFPPLAVGLAFGVGVFAGRVVQAAVVPRWGFWGALSASIVVTGVISGVVALLVTRDGRQAWAIGLPWGVGIPPGQAVYAAVVPR